MLTKQVRWSKYQLKSLHALRSEVIQALKRPDAFQLLRALHGNTHWAYCYMVFVNVHKAFACPQVHTSENEIVAKDNNSANTRKCLASMKDKWYAATKTSDPASQYPVSES